MDFLWPINSRHVLAAATAGLLVAAFGGACAAQDERGAMSQGGGYQGPYLTWSGKQAMAPAAAPASPAQEDAADLTEARYAPAPNYTPSGAGAPVSRYASQGADDSSSDVSESRYAAARYAAPQPQEAPPPERPPASIFAAPPAPAPEPVAAPAPQPAAVAQPVAAPVQPAQAQPAEGTTGVHFYSLHRAYGMSPDPIPAPTEGHTVLIAAPDHGAAADGDGQAGDQDQDGAGDGDGKPAAHGDGSGGDGHSGDN